MRDQRSARRTAVLALETLEARLAPAAFTITDAQSYENAIEQVNTQHGGTLNFAGSVQGANGTFDYPVTVQGNVDFAGGSLTLNGAGSTITGLTAMNGVIYTTAQVNATNLTLGASLVMQGGGDTLSGIKMGTETSLSLSGGNYTVDGVSGQGEIDFQGSNNTFRNSQFGGIVTFTGGTDPSSDNNQVDGVSITNGMLQLIGSSNTIDSVQLNGADLPLLDVSGNSNSVQNVNTSGGGSVQVAGDNNTVGNLHSTDGAVTFIGNTNTFKDSQVDNGLTTFENGSGDSITGNTLHNNSGPVLMLNGCSNATVGGTGDGDRNVLSGSGGVAFIELLSPDPSNPGDGNVIEGNYLGTDSHGTAGGGTEQFGISIPGLGDANNVTIGGAGSGAGNVIVGYATDGIDISASGGLIAGNLIGVDSAGTPHGGFDGVHVDSFSSAITIGGNASAANVIGGNRFDGIGLDGNGITVAGNLIGTDRTGTKPLPNGTGITVNGNNNLIGGTSTSARNLVAGNSAVGIAVAGNSNAVEGNFVGVDVSGQKALGNGSDGVSISGANNTIGGNAFTAGNILGGNGGDGVFVGGAGNIVQANYIGTNATSALLGNAGAGIYVTGTQSQIGAFGSGDGNVIGNNQGDGITIKGESATQNKVAGNYIGTSADQNSNLGNHGNGISIIDAPDNTLGDPAGGDVIGYSGEGDEVKVAAVAAAVAVASPAVAGPMVQPAAAKSAPVPKGNGILVRGQKATGNKIVGELIGIDKSNRAVGNKADGVLIQGAMNATIGGTTTAARNVISANGGAGVRIAKGADGSTATGNVIEGNFIGTDSQGTTSQPGSPTQLGNLNGVSITGDNNTVGAAQPSGSAVSGTGNALPDPASNRIGGNQQNGVLIIAGKQNRVSQNLIYADGAMPINLGNVGITAPGAHSGDGPNKWQNYPILNSVVDSGGTTSILGTVPGALGQPFWVEFYANSGDNHSGLSEGAWFLGAQTYTVSSAGYASISFNASTPAIGNGAVNGIPVADHFITAVAIDLQGNTSEFSPCRDILRNAVVSNRLSQGIQRLLGGAGSIDRVFQPNSVLGAVLTPQKAAQDCGVDHFNFLQYIVQWPANWQWFLWKQLLGVPLYPVSGPLAGRILDPLEAYASASLSNVMVLFPGTQKSIIAPPPNDTDPYPFYWNDLDWPNGATGNLSANLAGTALNFFDKPAFVGNVPAGGVQFNTTLVGVTQNHLNAAPTVDGKPVGWAGLNLGFNWQTDGRTVSNFSYLQGTNANLIYGGVFNIEYADLPPMPSDSDTLTIAAPAQATLGAPFSVTVSAESTPGIVDPSANGWITLLVTSGAANSAPVVAAGVPIVNGVATFSGLSLKGAGTYQLLASSDIGQVATGSLAVAPTTHFSVTTNVTTSTAGNQVIYTITALDTHNQPDRTYQGTVQLTSSDPQASFVDGNSVTFSAQNHGVVSIAAILGTAGAQTVTATDTTAASAKGTSTAVKVTAGQVEQLSVTASPQPGVIGAKLAVTVMAEDMYRNRVNSYAGAVSFGISGGTASLPNSYTFSGSDNGAHTFTITPTSVGGMTLNVTDGSNNGNLRIAVVSAATHLSVNVSSSGPIVAGVPFTITVKALDAANNPDVHFQDHLQFAGAGLSITQAFTSATGAQDFTVSLTKSGSQTITVTDTDRPAIKGSSPAIPLTAVATKFVLASVAPSAPVFGVPYRMTITAQDANGNPATAYHGSVQLTVGSGTASLPVSLNLTSASTTFAVTPQSLGGLTVNATDGVSNGALSTTVVSAATHLTISGLPAVITAGKPFTVTVSALTGSGQPAFPFQDVLHFADAVDATGLPADAAFTGTNGQEQFTITLPAAGPQTLIVGDTSLASVKGASVAMNVQAAKNGITPAVQVSGPTVGVPGQPLTFHLTASETGAAANAVYMYRIDWFGNGRSVQVVRGPGSGTPATFVYPTVGNVTVKVTATDVGGDTGAAVTAPVGIVTTALEPDPVTGTGTALAIGCAANGSTILITPTDAAGDTIAVTINGVAPTLPSQPFRSILVFGQAGVDIVKEQAATIGSQPASITIPALLFGGTGTNTLSVAGSSANNIVIGGPGKSTLTGGTGRDILIGGGGPATVNAGSGDDIVVAGSTVYDAPTTANIAALIALMEEWQRTDIPYAQRVQDLSGTGSGGVNGAFLLDTQTVRADTAPSQLVAGAGMDWFWISVSPQKFDQITGYVDGEVVTLE